MTHCRATPRFIHSQTSRATIAYMRLLFSLLLTLHPVAADAQQKPVDELPINNAKQIPLLTNTQFGEVVGVAALFERPLMYVLSRSPDPGSTYGVAASSLFEYGASFPNPVANRVLAKNLYGFAFAHSVRMDAEQNIWVVDAGADVVMKLDPTGKIKMILGRRRPSRADAAAWSGATPATAEPALFRQPTDVAFDAQGNIYVADGLNDRIVKFDKTGTTVLAVSNSTLFTRPHNVAVDPRGVVYVAASEGIQLLDAQLKNIKRLSFPGRVNPTQDDLIPGSQYSGEPSATNDTPWALCINAEANPILFVADANRIYRYNISTGLFEGYYGKPGRGLKEFGWIHSVACPMRSILLVGELLNWRVQQLILP